MKTIKFIFLNLISLASMAAMEQSPASPLSGKPAVMGGYANVTHCELQKHETKNQRTQFDIDLDVFDALQQNNQGSIIDEIQLPNESESKTVAFESNDDLLDALAYALATSESVQIENQSEQSCENKNNDQEGQIIINDGSSNQPRYKCPITHCSKSFTSPISLTLHAKTHPELQDKFFMCDICLEYFTTENHRDEHSRTKHAHLLKYICKNKNCDKKFFTEDELITHKKIHDTFCCPICLKYCGSEHAVNKHLDEYHESLSEEYNYKCEKGCEQKFKSLGSRKIHYTKIHGDSDKDNWEWISELNNETENEARAGVVSTASSTQLKPPALTKEFNKEKKKKYICRYCNQLFANSHKLSAHKKAEHLDKYIYKCPSTSCNEIFDTNLAYKTHYGKSHKSIDSILEENSSTDAQSAAKRQKTTSWWFE